MVAPRALLLKASSPGPLFVALSVLLDLVDVVGRHGHQDSSSDFLGPAPAAFVLVDGGMDGVDDLNPDGPAELGEGARQWMAGLLAEALDESAATPNLGAVGAVAAHFMCQMTAANVVAPLFPGRCGGAAAEASNGSWLADGIVARGLPIAPWHRAIGQRGRSRARDGVLDGCGAGC